MALSWQRPVLRENWHVMAFIFFFCPPEIYSNVGCNTPLHGHSVSPLSNKIQHDCLLKIVTHSVFAWFVVEIWGKTSCFCRVGVPLNPPRGDSMQRSEGERKVSFPASQWNKLFFKLHLRVSAVGKPRLIEYRSQTKVGTFYFTSIEHFLKILKSALTLWVCGSLAQPENGRVLKTIKPYKKSQNSGTEKPLPFIWERSQLSIITSHLIFTPNNN